MNLPELDQLVEALRDSITQEPKRVAERLRAYASNHDDWRPFAFFAEGCYTRNLVARDARFELLLLCWDVGQESPIHNHEGQNCWMSVLEGTLEELRYPMPEPGHTGPLNAHESYLYEAGNVAFIRDEMGLHLVRPVGGRAVSLHLYATPYAECNVYCPETGRISRKRMSDYSVRGQLANA